MLLNRWLKGPGRAPSGDGIREVEGEPRRGAELVVAVAVRQPPHSCEAEPPGAARTAERTR